MATRSYRVLMVAPTSFFKDYGCHVRILEETRVLQRLGHRVTVVTYNQGRDLPDLDIVRTLPTPWHADYEVGSSRHKLAFDALLECTGLRLIIQRRFDVVHGHLHEGALIGWTLSRLQGIPLIFDMQGSLTGEMVDHGFLARDSRWYPLVRRLEYRITHLADHIITSTQQAATMVQQEFKRHHSVEPMPDCVNLDFFRPDVLSPQRRAMLRVRLGVPAKPPLVVYLGLLADYQGTHLLLKAARRIKAAGIACHFLIMGFPSVGHYARMAANLDIADCVTFTGMVPYERAPEYLSLGDVAVAPKLSLTEGAGKILNYMAMALPTVAYDSAINREYLGPLGTYAGPPGEVKGLADAIALLVTAQDRRADLGARLRERAGRLFCWERAAERLVSIYHHAKESQRPRGVKSNGSR